jgi:hypothetical protein
MDWHCVNVDRLRHAREVAFFELEDLILEILLTMAGGDPSVSTLRLYLRLLFWHFAL